MPDSKLHDGNGHEDPAFAPTETPREREPGALAMELVQARVHQRLFGGTTPEVSIGRFTVVATAGAGGLGIVYEAVDPELDRRVAIKLVSPSPTGSTVASQARLLAEAQTMARLSHPNIVTVHEVGEWDGRVFIAMEHVDGQTLERWVRGSPPPSRPQILRAYVQAGQGLAAAHRAGVIHRDFKPTNAMIDRSGRVRVLDFGLAIADVEDDGHGSSPGDGSTAVTHGGTPLYMAPEQHARRPATARSDQFAFCVSLWSALYGVHPFARDELLATIYAMATGAVGPPPGGGVPAWLRRILLRGLSASPDDRWPSMDALVDALERGQARARRRIVLATLGSVAVAAAAIAGLRELDERRRQATCERAGLELAAPWSDDARTAVSDAIMATGLPYSAHTVDELLPHLDAYAEALRTTGTAVCLEGEPDDHRDSELLGHARSCLDDRHDALAVLVEALSQADAGAVTHAVIAALALPEVEPCGDLDQLARLSQPPSEHRDEVRELRRMLARARVLRGAGHVAASLALVDEALPRARATEWAPVAAELEVERGGMLDSRGDYPAASRALHDAYLEAARVGSWNVAARAAGYQLYVVGVRLGRYEEGLLWNQLAEVAEIHAGERDGAVASGRLALLAILHLAQSDLPASKAAAEAAIAIDERVLGPDHPDSLEGLAALAEAHIGLAEYDQARALCERMLDVTERTLGKDHPAATDALRLLTEIEAVTGNLEQARAVALRALDIIERARGPEHPSFARVLANVGLLETMLGERASARRRFERAIPLLEAAFGPRHATVADVVTNLAISYYDEQDYDAALPLFERALAIEEEVLGPDHPDVARTLSAIANVHNERGHSQEAQQLLERALAIDEAALGPDHPEVGILLHHLAGVAFERGEHERALALTERALVVLEAHEGVQPGEPGAQFMLAQLLVKTGGDRARALASARQAVEGFRARHRDAETKDALAWLAQHEAPGETAGKR